MSHIVNVTDFPKIHNHMKLSYHQLHSSINEDMPILRTSIGLFISVIKFSSCFVNELIEKIENEDLKQFIVSNYDIFFDDSLKVYEAFAKETDMKISEMLKCVIHNYDIIQKSMLLLQLDEQSLMKSNYL